MINSDVCGALRRWVNDAIIRVVDGAVDEAVCGAVYDASPTIEVSAAVATMVDKTVEEVVYG